MFRRHKDRDGWHRRDLSLGATDVVIRTLRREVNSLAKIRDGVLAVTLELPDIGRVENEEAVCGSARIAASASFT
jgi:hypothetical protein